MNDRKENLTYDAKPKKKGVLGTLEGICADCINGTRNGRKYSDKLWKKAFNDPVVQEHFKCGGIFGCLGHPPEDISEPDLFEKIAICMPEPPVEGNDGKLRGRWDILDTPNGRILKCLCDYGYKIGISSRGSGETYTEYDGTESVDPDTYDFQAFDAVLLPAVKAARLSLVTESLDQNKKSFKQALQESIDKSNDVDRKVMLETLDALGIDYKESSETEEEGENSAVNSTDEVADSDGMDLVTSLQEALKENSNLQAQVFDLNEKLSVSYTKEMRLNERITKLTESLSKLANASKKAEGLKNQLTTMKVQLESKVKELSRQKDLTESYKEKVETLKLSKKELTESASASETTASELKQKVDSLKSNLTDVIRKDNELIESLRAELDGLRNDSKIKNSQYSSKLNESKESIEKYKNIAKVAIDKYIDCKATNLGISASDIKDRLKESYSFNEIDEICEDLRRYSLNISKLPFQVGKGNIQKVALKENMSQRILTNPDDVVDGSILELLG